MIEFVHANSLLFIVQFGADFIKPVLNPECLYLLANVSWSICIHMTLKKFPIVETAYLYINKIIALKLIIHLNVEKFWCRFKHLKQLIPSKY